MADLNPFEIPRFGGWKPSTDPQELGWAGAENLLNVDIRDDGRLRVRDGLYEAADTTVSMHGLYTYPKDNNSSYLVSFSRGTALRLYYYASSYTAESGTWSSDSPYVWTAPVIGTPTETSMFITSAKSDASIVERLKKWIGPGNAVASSSVNTKPLFAEVTPTSNRLALGGFIAAADTPSGANGSLHTVFFSDDNAPETFDATNYVHLTPGDGERIMEMVAYRDFLIVFKETKFFVFYGESTDESGGAIFNYRTVPLPRGRINRFGSAGQHVAAAGPGGVYFLTSAGVFVTDGGQPREISQDIQTVFDDLSGSTFGVACVDERVYVTGNYIPEGDLSSTPTLFVYDTVGNYWLKWTSGAGFYMVGPWWASNRQKPRVAAIITSDSKLYYTRSTQTTDDGTAISSYYYTGLQQVSPPGTEGKMREVLLDGTGTFDAQIVCDGTASTSASVTPTAGTIGRYRKSARGRTFQLKVSASSGQWELSRVVGNMLPGRKAGAS